MDNLKSCPFCGGEALFIEQDDHDFCVTLWRYALGKMMEEQDVN